jgi:hypothetical protein
MEEISYFYTVTVVNQLYKEKQRRKKEQKDK